MSSGPRQPGPAAARRGGARVARHAVRRCVWLLMGAGPAAARQGACSETRVISYYSLVSQRRWDVRH
eukprot:4263708-Prymnesium_polylepis.1